MSITIWLSLHKDFWFPWQLRITANYVKSAVKFRWNIENFNRRCTARFCIQKHIPSASLTLPQFSALFVIYKNGDITRGSNKWIQRYQTGKFQFSFTGWVVVQGIYFLYFLHLAFVRAQGRLGGPVIFFTFFIGYHLLGGYLHKIIGTPTDGRLRSVTPMKIMMWRHTKCIFSKFLWTDCPSGRFFSVLFGGGTPSKSFDSARRIRPRYPRVWGKPDAIGWFIFGDIGIRSCEKAARMM